MACESCGEECFLRYRCTGELLCHDCWGDTAWDFGKKGSLNCEWCGIVGELSCLRTYKEQKLCIDCWQSAQEYADSPWDAGSELEPDQMRSPAASDQMRRPAASAASAAASAASTTSSSDGEVACPEYGCDDCGRGLGRLQEISVV